MGKARESTVVIDGVTLAPAQVMTLRVAVSDFLSGLVEHGCGDDEHGRAITAGYLDRGREVEAMLVNGGNARRTG